MAKFLTTVGNSYYIEQVILNANKNLTLVTPYLNLSKNLINRLADADKSNILITLIYGKSELNEHEKKKIESLKNLEIYFCENLHAKCYHNENSLIITSMNLYEFSERNNREMGLLVEKSTDLDIYEDTLKEIESIKNSSIKEKEVKPTKNTSLVDFKIDPNYSESINFHLPSLFEILKSDYPNHKITFDESLIVNDFPKKGIDLSIKGTVNFLFSNKDIYENIKKSKKDTINSQLNKFRVYWNWKKINIYEEKGFVIEISENGLKTIIERTLEVVKTIYKELNNNV